MDQLEISGRERPAVPARRHWSLNAEDISPRHRDSKGTECRWPISSDARPSSSGTDSLRASNATIGPKQVSPEGKQVGRRVGGGTCPHHLKGPADPLGQL
jgi:hypothetical protein